MKTKELMNHAKVGFMLVAFSSLRLMAAEEGMPPTPTAGQAETSKDDELVEFEMPPVLSPEELIEEEKQEALRRAEVERLSLEYQKADTPRRRMEICIAAIDSGVINTLVPLETLEKLFGIGRDGWNRKMVQGVGAKEGQRAFIIHFANYQAPKTAPGQFMAGLWGGWYLYVRYNSERPEKPIYHFYLSNTWQLTKGFEP